MADETASWFSLRVIFLKKMRADTSGGAGTLFGVLFQQGTKFKL